MFLPDSRPAVPLPRFSRHLNVSEGDGGDSGEVCVRLGLYSQVSVDVALVNFLIVSQFQFIFKIISTTGFTLLLIPIRDALCLKLGRCFILKVSTVYCLC